MTNASPEQIVAANESKLAKAENVQRVAQGLPQIAVKAPKKVLSVMEILQKNMSKDAPKPTGGKQETKVASQPAIRKICPELTDGLIRPDGTCHPGSLMYSDVEGKYGSPGAIYVCRFVPVNKPTAKYVLDNFGLANRTPTTSKLKDYTAHMDAGIGGGNPHGWQFVFNTAIFTVDFAGSVTGVDLEQHNLGHTCRSVLAAADPKAEILAMFCFGVPKSCRDIIDKNQARTAKDIASTRTELREMFEIDTMIGGLVKITAALSTQCIGYVTQTTAIVNNIRKGLQAKTGGNQGVDADVLDVYTSLIGMSVQGIVALNHVCATSTVNKAGLTVEKTGGGLVKRYAVNHLAAVQSLLAGWIDPETKGIRYSEEIGNAILDAYSLLANENETDQTEPMVSLRMQIDFWDKKEMHKGSAGMNVRFTALKMAVMKHLAGEKIHATNWLSLLTPQSGNNIERLNGFGFVDPTTGEACTSDTEGAISVGIDDYEDPAAKAMESAGTAAATAGDASLEELIDDTEEITEETGDTPEEEDVAEDV